MNIFVADQLFFEWFCSGNILFRMKSSWRNRITNKLGSSWIGKWIIDKLRPGKWAYEKMTSDNLCLGKLQIKWIFWRISTWQTILS